MILKKTKTRDAIIELLNQFDSPLSAQQIYKELQDKNITLSSIYRTLDTFTNAKLLIKDSNPEGIAVYTLLKKHHHHYLECNLCHKKIEIEDCPYHKVNHQLKNKYDFQVDEHNVVIYGTCANCLKKRK